MNDERVDTEVDPISRSRGARGMMSEFYELTSLACAMLGTSEVAKAARDWVAAPDATGELLGCWRTEFGTLGRLLILRSFDTLDALHQERRRALLSANPFNAGRRRLASEGWTGKRPRGGLGHRDAGGRMIRQHG